MTQQDRPSSGITSFHVQLLLLAAFIVVLLLVAWTLTELLLLIFASVLAAVILTAAAHVLSQWTPLNGRLAVVVAGLGIVALVGGFAVLLGAEVRTQFLELVDRLPRLLRSLEDRLGIPDLGEQISDRAGEIVQRGSFLQITASYTAAALGIVANLVLVLVGGVYLALEPGLYRRGLLLLFPPRFRPKLDETLRAIGNALTMWLAGQLVAMVLVGVVTSLGLWLIGVPSALALGLTAGLLEFVPFVGPILAAIPAVAIGFAAGTTTGAWVLALYLAIQQAEGNFITPLIQRKTVNLPPALTIFSIVGFGLLFGVLGVVLATPLTVALFVIVSKLWVGTLIGTDVDVPGETAASEQTGEADGSGRRPRTKPTTEAQMNRTVTAIYRTHAVADLVRRELQELGVTGSHISVIPDREIALDATGYRDDPQVLDTLHGLHLPEDDLRTYQQSVRRGDYVVSANVDDSLVARAQQIMRRPETEAHDIFARDDEFRHEALLPRADATAARIDPDLVGEREVATEDPYVRSYRRKRPLE